MVKQKKQKEYGSIKGKDVHIRASYEFVEALKQLEWGNNPTATRRLAKDVLPFLQDDLKNKQKKRGGFDFDP